MSNWSNRLTGVWSRLLWFRIRLKLPTAKTSHLYIPEPDPRTGVIPSLTLVYMLRKRTGVKKE